MNEYKILNEVDDFILNKLIILDKKFYKTQDVGKFSQLKQFLSINPNIYTFLMLGDIVVGYINFVAISDNAYNLIRAGKLKDYNLHSSDIIKFNKEKATNCLFLSIVIDKPYQNTDAIINLMNTFKRKISDVKIKNIIFDCVSDDGEKFAKEYFDASFVKRYSNSKIYESSNEFILGFCGRKTKKAGCYLVDIKEKKLALVYRKKQDDWSFPKGHLEKNETLEECAVRETAEETKRIAKIVEDIDPIIERYVTPNGEECECYMYIAIDSGKSDNSSLDVHDTLWFDINDVDGKLSYQSLKNQWQIAKSKIIEKLFMDE